MDLRNLAFCFLLLWITGLLPLGADVDIETVRARLLAEWHRSADAETAGTLSGQLEENGAWPDLDYRSTLTTNWPVILHMERIQLMTRAYSAPGLPTSGQASLRDAIRRALSYWFSNDFTNENWWYNEIGVPRQLAPVMVMLKDDLSGLERLQGLRILQRARIQGESQNLVWLTEINAQRGLVTDDAALVETAYRRIAEEIRLVDYTGEGTQVDGSFLQHRRCLYNHGYGSSFVIDGARIAAQVAGTRFAFAPDKVDLLTSLLLDGSQWMTRYRFADFGARGREFTRRPQTTAGWMIQAADFLLQSDTGRDAELEALKRRAAGQVEAPLLNGNRMFWRGDMMVHHRDAFYVSVRMFSSRLANTDFNGPENQFGHHLADGLTVISRKGSEFEQLYPVWDWQKLPGTTARQSPPLVPGQPRLENGSSDFAGGVSNGRYGVAAFDFERDGLRASKAWFFFEKGFVALAAGLSDLSQNRIQTTLNQTSRSVLAVELSRGVWHDNVAYIALDDQVLQSEIRPATGSWSQINLQQPATPFTKSVFTVWIDHGIRPVNQHYAYWVEPGISSAQARESSETPPVKVSANTPDIQAAWDPAHGVGGAVFHLPGRVEVTAGAVLESAQPGLVLLESAGNEWRLWFADPTQRLSGPILLHLNGLPYHAELPAGAHAGSSVELKPVRLDLQPGPPLRLQFERPRESTRLAYLLESRSLLTESSWTEVTDISAAASEADPWESVVLELNPSPTDKLYRLRISPR